MMEFDWKLAEPLFEKIESPDYGHRTSWMRWYREAWEFMCAQGLAHFETPLDDCVIRLRIFSLGWLAHDFCATVLGNEWGSDPHWSEWIDQLEIEPTWCLLTGVDPQQLKHIVDESLLVTQTDIEIEDDEVLFDRDWINQDLFPRLAMVAVYAQREKIVDVLFRCFDGPEWLFAALYSNCSGIEEEIEQRRDELEEELEMLEDERNEMLPEKERGQLERQIESLRLRLGKDELVKDVTEELRLRIAGDPIGCWGDESAEKHRAYDWCLTCCPVVVEGEPPFWRP